MRNIYKMEPIAEEGSLCQEIDYLFIAGGSDSRAYEVLGKIDGTKTKVILFHFSERIETLDLTSSDPYYKYKLIEINNLYNINCCIKDPSSCLSEISKISISDGDSIGIDISCFTKPYFFYLLKLFRELLKIDKVCAFYTEPKSYIFSSSLFNTFHSSTGPLSIHEMQGFPGSEQRDSLRQLVILLGFDGDLAKEINEDVSPNQTFIVNGFPSYTPKFKDVSLISNEKLVGDRNIQLEYSLANNPFDTYNLLNSIKSNHQGKNMFINIAPLGTKPMALGACLFALHNPDVRIVYPLPENYENKYSERCWKSWGYILPLSI